LQKKRSIADSPQQFIDDMRRAGRGLNHPALVRILAEEAAGAIDWTRQELGVRYLDRLDRFGGHSVARSLTTRGHSGVDIIKAQVAKLQRLGVEIRTRCRLRRLIRGRRGRVAGVEIQEGFEMRNPEAGRCQRIRARRAVVLATGGFAADVRFRSRLNPGLDAVVQTTNHKGATAEGLAAALRIAAFPVHLSWIQLGPWGCPDEKGYGRGGRFASYAVFPAGILIDPATGRRIVNEWADRRQRSEAMMRTGHPSLGIVDARGAATDAESLASGLRAGKIKAFDAVTAIAATYGTPPEVLLKTVDDYNDAIARGAADSFGKPLSRTTPKIARPPFYAIRLSPKVHYTLGGIAINTRAQVLDLDGRPIARLLAAGEVCGGVHGASRLGSCALTEGLVFGRIAGREAAALSMQRDGVRRPR
jgi:flavocytochrome c